MVIFSSATNQPIMNPSVFHEITLNLLVSANEGGSRHSCSPSRTQVVRRTALLGRRYYDCGSLTAEFRVKRWERDGVGDRVKGRFTTFK